ncbi:trimeric intracellular cation channel family protein [Luteibacter aegosomatissinici]|uniref:trimeric intracellular cation channel family protein n=1 Tax=Luteibacter aegosomatissinici TaxID=2911539 RepID=UPI001FFBECE1|nr:trimeric intracellular cation channel family protein [Luteibacter aegosomatissinici]UPG93847.1 trimeric intracellular cation channel family protein [Luteibacter aegosomatissinici]
MVRKHVVLAGDLAGTVVFAIEGAMAAIHAGLDLLGVLVLSFIVALGGGVVRDLLIGATPPNAIQDWRYPLLAFAAGLVTFTFHTQVAAAPPMLLITLDAAGLAIFAATGAEKALDYKITPVNAVLMGAVTGCGGGVIRDLLLTRTPLILMADIYATAALLGAAVVVVCTRLRWSPALAMALGCVVCFAVRMLAVVYHWQLPRVG